MSRKIRVAVVGFGNVGRAALEAIEITNDLEVAGIVTREYARATVQRQYPGLPVTSVATQLTDVDVAILAVPSRNVEELASELLASGISTVDSFDIHGSELWQLRQRLDIIAKGSGVAAILGAGWDPGTDSMLRAIFVLQAPRGISYTNFGPGVSMGHTVAAKKIPGVRNALAFTFPKGHGEHRRLVYVELDTGYAIDTVAAAILRDPYFCHDETEVRLTDSVAALSDTGHGVLLERRGTAGRTANQYFRYESHITNPAVTGQILVGAARAARRLAPGAYTMLEVPLMHFLPGDIQKVVEQLV